MGNVLIAVSSVLSRTFRPSKNGMMAGVAIDARPYGTNLRLVSAPWAGWYLEDTE